MKTDAVSFADLNRCVIAVPPLARHPDLSFDPAGNAAIIRHVEAGGVRTLLYGGNANFYNVGMREYPALLDGLARLAGPDTWVIPSAGPDYGRLMDQVPILRERAFPTVMVLPASFAMTVDGVATGLRHFADRLGKPIVIYLKAEDYLSPEAVAALARDGVLAAIKYAIVRGEPREDAFLSRLLDNVDRRLVVSGMGERPAIVHMRDFGLAAFTSGSVCVGPRGSMRLLAACKQGDFATAEDLRARYLPLEDLRDAISPIRVLHEAVRLCGIADTGPLLPLLSNVPEAHRPAIAQAADALLAFDRSLA